MKSHTKTVLSNDQILQLVKTHFGENSEIKSIKELKGGFFNSAYAIERINEEDAIILKVSAQKSSRLLTYEKDLMRTEVEVYRLLAEKTTVPIPKLLAFDFSRIIVPCDYFFMSRLTGETMNHVRLSKSENEEIQKELADYIAQIHGIQGTYFGYFSQDSDTQYTSWKKAFLHMFDDLLKDGMERNIRLPYETYRTILEKQASILDTVQQPSLVDFDLHPGNIFLKKQNGKYVIEGIVDFERAFWGDPYAEFPAAFLMISDVRNNPVFWKEYRKNQQIDHDFTRSEEMKSQLYRLYLFTIMCVEIGRYGFFYSRFQSFFSKTVIKHCLAQIKRIQSE